MTSMSPDWISEIKWGLDGLVPVIAQDQDTGKVLTHAWMNREALEKTVALGRAVYWSRSRQKLWYKGEISGHVQEIHEVRADCDMDTVLLLVRQIGGIACHTGRFSCFYMKLHDGQWQQVEKVIKDPEQIYGQQD